MGEKIRLDVLLVEQGKVSSRERARALIMSGSVFLDGNRLLKPGTPVSSTANPEVRQNPIPFVSRGGLKLEKALDVFQIDVRGRDCIDCGASTGGFTDCLLQRGARQVWAVDVGYGQLDWRLRQDDRVIVMERTNVRYLKRSDLGGTPSLAVIDLSFISLNLVLPTVYHLLTATGEALCLVKPQFEAGKEQVGKKGVVKDPAVHRWVLERFLEDAQGIGFGVLALDYSPVKGPQGNIEYLGYLKKDASSAADLDVQTVVAESHGNLD